MKVEAEGRADPDIVAQAAAWVVELDGDEVSPEVVAACEAWCQKHPLHRRTLERMRALDGRFDSLDGRARRVLQDVAAPARRRKRGVGAVAAAGLVGVLVVGGWLGLQSRTFRALSPQYETARGEQRTIALGDGSTLVLDTASAASVALTADRRRVELFHGQVFAQVAPDRDAPFVVRTASGQVTALGTAFIVREQDGATFVTVVESRVRACRRALLAKPACLELGPGEQARLGRDGVSRLAAVDGREASAWTTGWLEADDQPVVEVLDALNRYRAHPVDFDRKALSGVRVTGSYPLKDTDRALEAIAGSTGLRISRNGDAAVLRPAG
ncbi:FecR family protein [Caulobacter mirabilis]|uniref:Iron dicitrate transport regulator FecR n=1 Tax=Caulobacter mirabilis TaxID=69666 RepID=A0A2D2B2Z9_9CAUL|nr:FecR domain-containing protein [Caulobacter mirabilis]ATQ44622.1 iron dicitrate transport regulator FecR [Caulobacter mirabilis]